MVMSDVQFCPWCGILLRMESGLVRVTGSGTAPPPADPPPPREFTESAMV